MLTTQVLHKQDKEAKESCLDKASCENWEYRGGGGGKRRGTYCRAPSLQRYGGTFQ